MSLKAASGALSRVPGYSHPASVISGADFLGIKLTTNREMPIFGLPTAAAVASFPLELQPCKQNKYLPVGCC